MEQIKSVSSEHIKKVNSKDDRKKLFDTFQEKREQGIIREDFIKGPEVLKLMSWSFFSKRKVIHYMQNCIDGMWPRIAFEQVEEMSRTEVKESLRTMSWQ